MTKARGFGIVEEAFWDDDRFDNGNNLSQLLYLRLWVQFTNDRVTKRVITKYDFVYLGARFRCTREDIDVAFDLLKSSGLILLKKVKEGVSIELPGIKEKQPTVRSWDGQVYNYSIKSPSMDTEVTEKPEGNHPCTDDAPSMYHPPTDDSEELERNGTERELEQEPERREDQQPLGSSPPPEDPEPPPGSSPPQRSVRSHDSKPRTPGLPKSTAPKSGTPETPGGGKRPLPSWGEGFLQELHEAMSRGEPGIVKAQELLKCRMGLNVFQALKALKTDPQRLCEWCYSAMTEGKNPTGLLVQYLKSTPDFRDVANIYGEVKRILFEVPEGALVEVLAGGER